MGPEARFIRYVRGKPSGRVIFPTRLRVEDIRTGRAVTLSDDMGRGMHSFYLEPGAYRFLLFLWDGARGRWKNEVAAEEFVSYAPWYDAVSQRVSENLLWVERERAYVDELIARVDVLQASVGGIAYLDLTLDAANDYMQGSIGYPVGAVRQVPKGNGEFHVLRDVSGEFLHTDVWRYVYGTNTDPNTDAGAPVFVTILVDGGWHVHSEAGMFYSRPPSNPHFVSAGDVGMYLEMRPKDDVGVMNERVADVLSRTANVLGIPSFYGWPQASAAQDGTRWALLTPFVPVDNDVGQRESDMWWGSSWHPGAKGRSWVIRAMTLPVLIYPKAPGASNKGWLFRWMGQEMFDGQYFDHAWGAYWHHRAGFQWSHWLENMRMPYCQNLCHRITNINVFRFA